jgi:hypothetical protein
MIVGFTGLAASGKSTSADYLVRCHGFVRVKFADPLKSMLRHIGLSDAEIEGNLKEQPSALLMGKTPRWAMQALGHEWGRVCIHSDFWVGLWQRTACDVIDHGGSVVVDDCRYENELKMLESMSARICRITRPGAGTASSHVSEKGNLSAAFEIDNSSSLPILYRHLDALVTIAKAA